jgi:hypothetical protein
MITMTTPFIVKLKGYIIYAIAMAIIGLLYTKFKKKVAETDAEKEYRLVREFLLDDAGVSTYTGDTRPVLWIHTSDGANHGANHSQLATIRKRAYLEISIQSIIQHCGESFKICMIDDSSFTNLMVTDCAVPSTPDPIKSHHRTASMVSLLAMYGGMVVPASFICKENLINLYHRSLRDAPIFIGEFPNRSLGFDSDEQFIPDMRFMGARKGCNEIIEMSKIATALYTTDTSHVVDMKSPLSEWCLTNKAVATIAGQLIGTKDANGNEITVEMLLSDHETPMYNGGYGLYIPEMDLETMTAYNWFCHLSADEVVKANTFVSKYINMVRE